MSDLGPADEGLVLSSEGLKDKQDKVGTDPRKEPARAQSTFIVVCGIVLSWCEARAFPVGVVWSVCCCCCCCCCCSARKEQPKRYQVIAWDEKVRLLSKTEKPKLFGRLAFSSCGRKKKKQLASQGAYTGNTPMSIRHTQHCARSSSGRKRLFPLLLRSLCAVWQPGTTTAKPVCPSSSFGLPWPPILTSVQSERPSRDHRGQARTRARNGRMSVFLPRKCGRQRAKINVVNVGQAKR